MVITAIMGMDPLDMCLALTTLEVDVVTTVNMALDTELEVMVVVMGDMVDMVMVDMVVEGAVTDMAETGITGDMVPVYTGEIMVDMATIGVTIIGVRVDMAVTIGVRVDMAATIIGDMVGKKGERGYMVEITTITTTVVAEITTITTTVVAEITTITTTAERTAIRRGYGKKETLFLSMAKKAIIREMINMTPVERARTMVNMAWVDMIQEGSMRKLQDMEVTMLTRVLWCMAKTILEAPMVLRVLLCMALVDMATPMVLRALLHMAMVDMAVPMVLRT